jgi:hypothetical protein
MARPKRGTPAPHQAFHSSLPYGIFPLMRYQNAVVPLHPWYSFAVYCPDAEAADAKKAPENVLVLKNFLLTLKAAVPTLMVLGCKKRRILVPAECSTIISPGRHA